ncbi:MAG: SurA N-terminal domain-containing protein [Alphaproteobacteria bacterium]
MIYKCNFYIIIIIFVILFETKLVSDEKFEGLIVSVDSEAVTTYDLSERIKIVLKSLNLEDNIKNRDSVRDRVLELLILEKIKKIESQKFNIVISDEELEQFIAKLYDFPVDEYEKFKIFLEQQNIDIDVIKEQLKAELMWKKFTRQKFSSKITINKSEVDTLASNLINKVGKVEYNYSEILFKNVIENDWKTTKKRMNKVLSLLESKSSFDLIAKNFDENISTTNLEKNRWVLEDNLDENLKNVLDKLDVGEVKSEIKIKNGYKILKLNQKRIFGLETFTYSFIKFSSFNRDLNDLRSKNITCDSKEDNFNFEDISFVTLENIRANEISEIFRDELRKTDVGFFTNVIEISGENNILLICDKLDKENQVVNREKIETKIFSEKFNQLSNTYLTNLRKNINVKFFAK